MTESPTVKQAMKAKVEIVHPDWIELSMTNNKKLPVTDYSHKALQKKAMAKKRRSEQIARGHELAERYINTSKFEIQVPTTSSDLRQWYPTVMTTNELLISSYINTDV
jgi:hypothetical protein